MKKKYSAIAILGLSAIAVQAHAQSSTVMYGKLDLGVMKFSGDLPSDQRSPRLEQNHVSRLGFKGTEDLGDGLAALYQLEMRFNADTGTQYSSSTLFHGPTLVGLSGKFGTIKLGRNWGNVGNVSTSAIDPFEGDGVAGLNPLILPRVNNSVTYYSPSFSGFGLEVQYMFGEKPAGLAAGQDNDGFGASISYATDNLRLGLGARRAANSNKSIDGGMSAAYTIGAATLLAGYDWRDNKEAPNLPTTKSYVLAATYSVGLGLVKFGYTQTKNGSDNTLTNFGDVDKLRKFSLGYQHNLSKRTSLYADIANTRVNQASVSKSANAIGVGITHNF
ncbi:porin [soil metagenome]